MRKLLIGLAALVVVLIAAVLVVPGFLDWNQYKRQITAAAQDATGRSVAIDGDISLRLLPAPALSAAGVRIGNIAGGSADDMVRLKSLDVRVAFVPLLSGRIDVQSVRLIEPVALFEVLADGRANWQLGKGTASPAPGSGGTAGGPAQPAGDEPLKLALNRFEIVDGEVVYRDARNGTEERLTGLNLSGSADSLRGPFTVAGDFAARGLSLRLDLTLGRIAEGRSVPVSLQATLGEELEADLKGRIEGLPASPKISGLLRLRSPDLVQAAARGGIDLPGLLAQPVQLDSRISASTTELALNDIVLDLGVANAGGAINLGLQDGLTFDAALTLGRLDLDTLLAARTESAGDADTGGDGTAGDDGDAASTAPLVVPTGVAGNLTVSVDGIAYQGSVVRQVQLAASMLDGQVELSRASALLPGGSDVSLTGQAINADGAARFDGRLVFASDSLRSLLTWLDVDVGTVPADRLTSFSVTTDVVATPVLIQMTDANLRLDTVAATAAVAYRLQRRPSFGVSLSVDRFDLDAYRPPSPDGDGASDTRARVADDDGDGENAATGGGLALLDGFDANLLLNIARLTAREVDLNGVAIDASLVGGTLELRKLQVADLAGGTLTLDGTARGFAGEPELDLSLLYGAADLGGLLRLAGVDGDTPAARLSDVRLAATVRGTASALALRTQLAAAGGRGRFDGTVADLQSAPKLAFDFQLEHPSLAGLATVLALELAPADADDKPVKLRGTVEGAVDDLQTTAELELAAARLAAAGRLGAADEYLSVDMTLRLAGDDLLTSLAALGVSYRPAADVPGGYGVDLRLAGDTRELTLQDLSARVGPIEVTGGGKARFDGDRPHVTASLDAGDVNLDLLQARRRGVPAGGVAAPGGPPPMLPGGERWSRDPIDISALQTFDADLVLRAAGMTYDRYPFVDPRLSLSLRDGTLTLTELTGRLFDGAVMLQGTLASRPVPALTLTVRLEDANLEQGLRTALGFTQVSGTGSFEGDFRARGASERGLVRSLNGRAALRAKDGVIRGFDMQGFSDRLGELNSSGDYVDLLARSFSGGQTALTAAEGTWVVENGVARTDDTKADLDASQATLTGNIDLANWSMDLRTQLRLTEHADAPGLGIDLTGPLDAPERRLRTRALEQYLVARLGQELLRKGLGDGKVKEVDKILELLTKPGGSGSGSGGRSGGTTPEPSGGDQPAPSGSEEVLDSLLKGLLKR